MRLILFLSFLFLTILNHGQTFIEQYASGEMKVWVEVKDGAWDGRYFKYYPNGNLMEKGALRKGKFDGPFVTYHLNGKVADTCVFQEGKVEGARRMFYSTGKLKMYANYASGVLSGKYQKFFSAGSMMEKGSFVEGLKQGEFSYYNESGGLVKQEKYVTGEMVEQTIYTHKGFPLYVLVPREKSMVYNDQGALLIGKEQMGRNSFKVSLFHANGTIAEETVYLNNTIVKYKAWYPNGSLLIAYDKTNSQSLITLRSSEGGEKFLLYQGENGTDSIAPANWKVQNYGGDKNRDSSVKKMNPINYLEVLSRINGYLLERTKSKPGVQRWVMVEGRFNLSGKIDSCFIHEDIPLELKKEIVHFCKERMKFQKPLKSHSYIFQLYIN